MIVEVSKTATCGVDCQAEDTSESWYAIQASVELQS